MTAAHAAFVQARALSGRVVQLALFLVDAAALVQRERRGAHAHAQTESHEGASVVFSFIRFSELFSVMAVDAAGGENQLRWVS